MKAFTADIVKMQHTLMGSGDGPWIWLVELWRDLVNALYYCSDNVNTVFDSQTYIHTPMKVKPVASDSSGSTKNMQITLSNVDKVLITYIRAGEFFDQPMVLTRVHADKLGTVGNKDVMRGVILDVSADLQAATFICGNYDQRSVPIPADRYVRDSCGHEFKDAGCKYAGGETICDKLPDTCENTMNNILNIDAFLGMPIPNP